MACSGSWLRILGRAARLVLGVLAVVLGGPRNLPAAEPSVTAPAVRVTVEQGLLTVDLHAAPLADVLRVVAARAGVPISVRGPLADRLTDAFTHVPLDEGLRRLLRGHSLVLFYAPSRAAGGLPVLTRVSVIPSDFPASPAPGRPGGEVRTARGPHGPAGGAASGAVAVPLVGGARSRPETGPEALGRAGPAPTGAGVAPDGRASSLDAQQALVQQGDDPAVADLARLLAESPDALVRAQAAANLGILGGDVAADALARALRDPSAPVRLHAVRALGKAEGSKALPTLQAIVTGDPDPRVRRVAVRWLAALPGEEARAVLHAAASDTDESVRREVATALETWQR